ncbi:hypothetical protein BC937DRAFT_94303 [Endogone sp. FLAS-F59071]|nr:hypothetical protein BC937DRAFT_94303 [Endogone sp. FLAS-F59071]|eukprot:RUS20822.1 hypothetical protein BC937DRAFT_94303 [Endogone sp. FLAS-F59071]
MIYRGNTVVRSIVLCLIINMSTSKAPNSQDGLLVSDASEIDATLAKIPSTHSSKYSPNVPFGDSAFSITWTKSATKLFENEEKRDITVLGTPQNSPLPSVLVSTASREGHYRTPQPQPPPPKTSSLSPVARGVSEHWEAFSSSETESTFDESDFAEICPINQTSIGEDLWKYKEQLLTSIRTATGGILYKYAQTHTHVFLRSDIVRYMSDNHLKIRHSGNWEINELVVVSLMVWWNNTRGGLSNHIRASPRCESVHRLSRLLRNRGAHSCVLTNSYLLSMLYVSKKIARWAKDYRAGVQMGGRIMKPRDILKRVQSIETTVQQAIHQACNHQSQNTITTDIRSDIMNIYTFAIHHLCQRLHVVQSTQAREQIRSYDIKYSRMLGRDPRRWPVEHVANFMIQYWPTQADTILGRRFTSTDSLHVYLDLLVVADPEEWALVLFCSMAVWNLTVVAGMAGIFEQYEDNIKRIEERIARWC